MGPKMINAGKNIRRYRKQKGMTQDALAEKLHVTRQAISNWEIGKNQPDLDMLEETAKALDIDLEDLIRGEKWKYPRFQAKAIAWVIVLGIGALFLLADKLLIAPWLLELKGRTYRVMPFAVNSLVVQPVCYIALGMLVPAVVSLWYNVHPDGQMRMVLRFVSVLLLIPAILVILYLFSGYLPLFSRFVHFVLSDPTGFRQKTLCYFLPFFAGLCLYPAFIRLRTSASEIEPGSETHNSAPDCSN